MGLKWGKVLKWLRDNIPSVGYSEPRREVARRRQAEAGKGEQPTQAVAREMKPEEAVVAVILVVLMLAFFAWYLPYFLTG